MSFNAPTSSDSSSRSAALSESLEACKELQQDERLALESIYEARFTTRRDPAGRLVFSVSVDIDLQDECLICIQEGRLASAPPAPLSATSPAFVPSPPRAAGARQSGIRANASNFPSSGSKKPAVAGSGQHTSSPLTIPSTSRDLATTQDSYLKLRYLPPIVLVASLSPSYPLEVAPEILLEAEWLHKQLSDRLEKRLEPLWAGDPSIYIMVDELQTALVDWASAGNLSLNADRTIQKASNLQQLDLIPFLSKHDRLMRHSTFSSESFDCGICLETKKGARCTRLRKCGHVFCVECLYSYFELNIREGMVRNVGCADAECVKRNQKLGKDQHGSIEAEEIEEIVGAELKDRYVWLLEKQRVESDPTITYCPRDSCNAPVAKETNEDYERLRVCTACGYSFCVYCRRTYHGTKSGCVFRQADSIVDKYVNGDDAQKAYLEHRYGKNNVRKLVDMYLEEQANAQWIKDNSTRCPDCQLDIEKSFGCSHMTCARCQCHFCFRCGTRLNAKDPYFHFSSPGSSCFNRLFDYVPSENREEENLAVLNAMVAAAEL